MEPSEVKIQFWNKWRRPLMVFAVFFLVVLVTIFFLSSRIVRYLIEKNDVEWTGRNIEVGGIYVNPFSGQVNFNDVVFFEANKDSVFLSVDRLSADFSMWKLLKGTIELEEITLLRPKGTVIQNRKCFNFDDLIYKFSSKDSLKKTKNKIHLNLLNIKIVEGEFYFNEETIPVHYFVRKVNAESSGFRWDSDTIQLGISFFSGYSVGNIQGKFSINLASGDYAGSCLVESFDMELFQQYLKGLTNKGNLSADLFADLKISGNFYDKLDVVTKGKIGISDFHFGSATGNDFVSFEKMLLGLKEINPECFIYDFDSAVLVRPIFKYEIYDSLDNLQRMFGREGENISEVQADKGKFNLIIELATYIRDLSENFFKSNYKVGRIAVYKADIRFNDFSLNEAFKIRAFPVSIFADSIYKEKERVNLFLRAGIEPMGDVKVSISINPKNGAEFDADYRIQQVPLAAFNPYLTTYTSFPMQNGTLKLSGTWKVRNGLIDSQNHLLLVDPALARRVKNKGNKWIPVPFVLGLIQERGDVIDYQIPIKGDLKDPSFILWDVIRDLFVNMYVKPSSIPYLIHSEKVEEELETAFTLKWEMGQATFENSQQKFLRRLKVYLAQNPDARISVSPFDYVDKEFENILFFEAKKKFFLRNHLPISQFLNSGDSLKIDKSDIKNPLFVEYLNDRFTDTLHYTIQEKCMAYLGKEIVQTRLGKLFQVRREAFLGYFREELKTGQVILIHDQEIVPPNRFSFYRISYKGSIPERLQSAYREMNEINKRDFRQEYEKERKNK